MNGDPLDCPFCNARQPYGPGLAAGSRLTCVRCSESFALTAAPVPPLEGPPAAPPPMAPPRPSNRLVGGVVVGVMLAMAAVGLSYALLTISWRRDNDRSLPRGSRLGRSIDPTEPEGPASPLELAGLGYLPAATNVLACLRPADLLADRAAPLRHRSFHLGNLDLSLAGLADWAGVEPGEVDHVVLGVVLAEGPERELTPPAHVIVRTRRPYDAARVRAALKAAQPTQEAAPGGGKRTLYQASLRGFPGRLWLADERTVVLGVFSRLEKVPAAPLPGGVHLPAEVRRLVEQRLSPGAPAWAVGHASDLGKTVLPTLLSNVPAVPLLGRLDRVRGFALSLVGGDRPRLLGAFQLRDAATAEALEKSDLQPLRQKNPGRLRFARQGEWLDVQVSLGEKADGP